MRISELQTAYKQRGYTINERNGTWYLTKIGKPLLILKRYSHGAADNINENIQLLDEYIKGGK